LAYLANLNALQDEEKKSKAIKTQTWKKLFWFNIMISAVLFLYFKFTGQYLDLLGLSDKKLNFIQQIMTLLRQYFIPEAMWLLIIAVALYFILNLIISWKEHIEDKNYNMLTYWLIKLIFMLWMVFLACHLVVLTNQYLLPELPKIFGML
jgi:ABC-type phosphate/phosphonate transport system permease subunit